MDNHSKEAVKVVMDYEQRKNRRPTDISWKNQGVDVLSVGRKIEVKSVARSKPLHVVLNPFNIKALNAFDDYWLYIVYDLDKNNPKMITLDKKKIIKHKKEMTNWVIPIHRADRELMRVL